MRNHLSDEYTIRVLHGPVALTATANGSSVDAREGTGVTREGVVMLGVGAAADAGATLDVKIQHSDDNSTWDDLVAFDQVADTDDNTEQSVHIKEYRRYLRAVMTIAGGTSPSFTISVKALLTSPTHGSINAS